MLQLKIITPRKVVREDTIDSLSAPSVEGEITILKNHTNLFTLLEEGIVKIKKSNKEEEYLAIGGGYLETDGESLSLLVSRAYGQDEIDHKLTEKAIDEAQNILKGTKDNVQRHEASSILRRSLIDLKLLKKRKRNL